MEQHRVQRVLDVAWVGRQDLPHRQPPRYHKRVDLIVPELGIQPDHAQREANPDKQGQDAERRTVGQASRLPVDGRRRRLTHGSIRMESFRQKQGAVIDGCLGAFGERFVDRLESGSL